MLTKYVQVYFKDADKVRPVIQFLYRIITESGEVSPAQNTWYAIDFLSLFSFSFRRMIY